MYRIHQLKLPIDHNPEQLYKKAAQILGIKRDGIINLSIFKRSIDARDKSDLHYVYAVDVECRQRPTKKFKPNEVSITEPFKYSLPKQGDKELIHRPVIIGFGPAGLFAAYVLALAGMKPLVFERGKSAEERTEDIKIFLKNGKLNPESNVLFGEGGAGTFSDGKLNTLIKDKDGKGRFVLETFVKFGADPEILYDSKPHIGTDRLLVILKNIREEIIKLGGEIRFNSRFCGFDYSDDNSLGKTLKSLKIDSSRATTSVPAEACILATGHSARDVFEILKNEGLEMEAKAFAMGVRVIHPQKLISENQYGEMADKLPAAAYKLTGSLKNGRSIYSFCMCPGGYVINSSSEENGLLVNGMSYSGRDGKYANSAIIVNVTPDDYKNEGFGEDPLSGVKFQRKYESLAYKEGQGKIPVEYFGNFKTDNANIESITDIDELPVMIKGKIRFSDLHKCLPGFISESLTEGLELFDKKIPGFAADDVLLCGIESRTSSPVRIKRDENYNSLISGLMPCGEGAGYAGGIMSAALDGIRLAEKIISTYKKPND